MVNKTKRRPVKNKRKVTKEIKTRATRWDDFHYVTIYMLACDGFTDRSIAEALGVSSDTLRKWKSLRPAIRKALQYARKEGAERTTGISPEEYVFNRLPPKLQRLWGKININKDKNSLARMEKLMKDEGKRGVQHLFLHALVNSNFNGSEACRKVNISRSQVESWCTQEPDFKELMDEMFDHLKESCKGAYMQLVEYLEPSIVLHSARTLNRDFFGSEKMDVDVKGKIEHTVDLIDWTKLDLDLECKKKILEAVRKQKQNVIDVEAIPVKALESR